MSLLKITLMGKSKRARIFLNLLSYHRDKSLLKRHIYCVRAVTQVPLQL